MKTLIYCLILLLIPVLLPAQTVDSQTQKLIETYVKNNIDLKQEAVDPVAVSKVFSGKFYKITVGFVEAGSGASSCGMFDFLNVNGTSVKMCETVHIDLELPNLQSMIKSDFRLKDEAAAKLFEASLNVLYPVDQKEAGDIKHLKKGSQWIFIRNKFFDDFTAFIVTVGADGAVSKIEAKLGYTVK